MSSLPVFEGKERKRGRGEGVELSHLENLSVMIADHNINFASTAAVNLPGAAGYMAPVGWHQRRSSSETDGKTSRASAARRGEGSQGWDMLPETFGNAKRFDEWTAKWQSSTEEGKDT